MKTTHLSLLVGLFLGTILAFGSFADFVLVTLCGLVGLGVGLYLEGRVDVRSFLERLRKWRWRPSPHLQPPSAAPPPFS